MDFGIKFEGSVGPIKYGSVNFAVAMASEFDKNVDTLEFAEFSSRKNLRPP